MSHLMTNAHPIFFPLDYPTSNNLPFLIHSLGYGLLLTGYWMSLGFCIKRDFPSQLPFGQRSMCLDQKGRVVNL